MIFTKRKIKMKKALNIVVIILVIISFTWLINRNHELKKEIENRLTTTDTVYYQKPFKLKTAYPDFQVPKMVFLYKVDTVPIDRVEYKDKIITIIQKDSTRIEYNGPFLTNYPNSPKLIQILTTKNKLSITSFKTNCQLATEEYSVDYLKYQYNYSEGKLTHKKTSFIKRFEPVAQYTFRPFNNLHDLDLGLKYNTSKFNYEAGLNINYYPKFRTQLGTDLYLRLKYNF